MEKGNLIKEIEEVINRANEELVDGVLVDKLRDKKNSIKNKTKASKSWLKELSKKLNLIKEELELGEDVNFVNLHNSIDDFCSSSNGNVKSQIIKRLKNM